MSRVSSTNPDSLKYIKNVGPQRAKILEKMGISSVRDLLYHFPRKYQDRTQLKPAYALINGEVETVQGTVVSSQDIKPRRGLTITKIAFNDGHKVFYGVWFNQTFVKKQLPVGTKAILTGKVDRSFGIQVNVEDFEVLDGSDNLHTGRIVPVYPLTEGLPQRVLRTIIKGAVETFAPLTEEFLPRTLLERYRLPDIRQALEQIHFPDNLEMQEQAEERFKFEELFLLQLGLLQMKEAKETFIPGIAHKPSGSLVRKFVEGLPFELTGAQIKVVRDIFRDMEGDKPMNRLVQGDVGSGKTVVAAAALVKTVESGYQGAMMAPTEILAEQHYLTLQELLAPIGINVGLLTGSLGKKERELLLEGLRTGAIHVVVGTHALIQEGVEYKALALAITDEQHRFGVRQRAKLQEKGMCINGDQANGSLEASNKAAPDVLVMTATPIPRTLALTLYGDLDLSVINELPPGRKPVKTRWVRSKELGKVYDFIRKKLIQGRQVYIVCPLVEESEKVDLEAATELAEDLRNSIFPEFQVGILHGRMNQEEKDKVMTAYRDGRINILVATTVIEVGVNVPNAALILVKDAERFGLSQLHQLRGRVGRGEHQSFCILVGNPRTEEGIARMQVMEATTDGFVIAEKDLEIRGPGEFFGTRQSGLPDLLIANLLRDAELLERAREDAHAIINLDPGLHKPEYQLLKEELARKFKGRLGLINIS